MAAKERRVEINDIVAHWSKEAPMAEDRFVGTGYLALDYAFGLGLPANRIISIYSDPGVGKTLLALSVAKGVLEGDEDGVVLYLDVERGLNGPLLRNIFGADYEEKYRNRFVGFSPDSYEEAIQMVSDFIKTGKLRLMVIDSLSALQCADDIKAQTEGEGHAVGKKSRTEGPFLNFLKSSCSACNFSALFINQVTADFGGSSWTGPSTKMKGSKALPHFSSVIMRMQTVKSEKNVKGEFVKAVVKITNIKNRIVGNRFAYIHIIYGQGISNARTIAEYFKWDGIVKQSGAWFEFKHDTMDFGAGIGEPVKIQGIEECEKLINVYKGEIVQSLQKSGKLDEFFDSYIYK